MQVTELKNVDLDFHVKISIPSTTVDNEIQKELSKLAKNMKLDGFRAGKVPFSILNKKYRQSVRNDVVQHQINHNIQHVIKDRKLNIVGSPQIEDLKNEEGKELEFILKFELLPAILLPDLKKIKINKPTLVVSAKDIDEQIKKLAESAKEYTKETKNKIKKGDQVTIDAVGYIDDKAFEGGKVTDHKLVIGSGAFIKGFEEQLIGAKKGDEVEVTATFPKDYHTPDVAGKEAKFMVTINAVHSSIVPEINDELAKKFNCETMEELRKQAKIMLEQEVTESVYLMMKMNLFDQLEKILTFNVPQSLLVEEKRSLESQTANDKDTNLALKDKSEKELTEYYNKIATRRIRVGLMLAEYMKVKNLSIESEDINKAIKLQARNFPGQEALLFNFYKQNPKMIENLKGPILEEKAVRHIFDNEVTILEKNYTKKELEELLEQESERVVA